MFSVIGNQIIPLTGNVSGFLLSQQMVQYHVLNFLMLCCDNKKGNLTGRGVCRINCNFSSHLSALLHHQQHYLYCQ